MVKKIEGGGVWARALAVSFFLLFFAAEVVAHFVEAEPIVQPEFIPAAETALEAGRAGEASEIYRLQFGLAEGPQRRMSLVGPWARAAFAAGNLPELLDELEEMGQGEAGAADGAILRATVYQYFGDLHRAGSVLAMLADDGDVWRNQLLVWAQETGQLGENLPHFRRAWAEERSEGSAAAYLHALLEAEADREVEQWLAELGEDFAERPDFWRSQLSEFAKHGRLHLAFGPLEQAWTVKKEDDVTAFALAELRLFQGRVPEAIEMFWQIFRREETGGPRDGFGYFQRMNMAYHDRFAVRHRLGESLNRYGTDMSREFAFLGMRKNVRIEDRAQARTASLLFLRELSIPQISSTEFVDQIRVALGTIDRPPVQRFYAYAIIGAARALVAEVEEFAAGDEVDDVAAEYALFALNRNVLSTEKFPDLRDRIIAVTRLLPARFSDGRPLDSRRRSQQMYEQVLRRLGAEEGNLSTPAPGSRDESFTRIQAAAGEGDIEAAEAIYREMAARDENPREIRQTLLFLAQRWGQAGDPAQAGRLLAEFVVGLFPERVRRPVFSVPVEWNPDASFPPHNTILGPEDLEVIGVVAEVAQQEGVLDAFRMEMRRRVDPQSDSQRLGRLLMETTLLWWMNLRHEALEAARADADGGPDLTVLLIHLAGRQGEVAEAWNLIPVIAEDLPEAAARLRFALAVFLDYDREAVNAAAGFDRSRFSAAERIQVAAGLVKVSAPAEAGAWVVGLDSSSLSRTDEERLDLIRLRAAEAAGPDKAVGSAMALLLAELPQSFRQVYDGRRKIALEVLDRHGALQRYRDGLGGVRQFLPEAFALHLLEGELAEHHWRSEGAAAGPGEALAHYRAALRLRPHSPDLQVELAEWAARRQLYDVAVEEYERVLRIDAQSALLDIHSLTEIYRAAGALPRLLAFLEEWEAPEAWSVDEFYGLQPTDHLFRQLGEVFLEEGDEEKAEQAWRKALAINPVPFSEQTRVELFELLMDRGRTADALEVVRGYVTAPDPDPEFYLAHPFVVAVPRWLLMWTEMHDPTLSPIGRILERAREAEAMDALVEATGRWRSEHPDLVGLKIFEFFLLAQAGHPRSEAAATALLAEMPDEPATLRLRQVAEELVGRLSGERSSVD